MCLSLANKLRWSDIQMKEALKTSDMQLIDNCSDKYAHIQFHTDLYVESMSNISMILHPFYQGNKINTAEFAQNLIHDELAKIKQVVDNCDLTDKYKLFQKAENQVTDVVQVIDLWNKIKQETISEMKITPQAKLWFKNILLPKTYWELALKKTKHKASRQRLKTELEKCDKIAKNQHLPQEISNIEAVRLGQDAINLCRKFQRASSQVEGRNGYLSAINHNQRGFDENRLKVLTVVHNFDTRGIDGKTPAERLFNNNGNFNSLFDYILQNFGNLPKPRKRKLID